MNLPVLPEALAEAMSASEGVPAVREVVGCFFVASGVPEVAEGLGPGA